MTLKGLRILNTRPSGQGHLLHLAITKAGGLSIDLPVLAIEPTSTGWIKHLPPLSQLHHAIFISTNAVTHFFAGIKQQGLVWPASIQITAIGKATAAALSHQNIHRYHMPSVADSEHLLQMPIFQDLDHQTLLLVKGVGGKMDLVPALQRRGGDVISTNVYRRGLPNIRDDHLKSIWQDDLVDMILLTSQQAIHNLFALFEKDAHLWLRKKPCIVLSERIAETARACGMQHVMVSSYDTILSSLESRSS
ncbi:MAG: uroporphyrinogen-III synthase [Legionellales bacterium]|nr:uroporphyrinogen-III synthase [Legionellales bacterium]